MIEKDKTLSLTVDEQVNYSRPSIDILFESAAKVFGSQLIGVVLTGANNDGSYGLKTIKAAGGLVVVEDPATAEVKTMPKSALDLLFHDYVADYVLPLEKI
jgi:two-component system chemotaxis response regulator CheB